MLLFGWSKTSDPERSDERLVSLRHPAGQPARGLSEARTRRQLHQHRDERVRRHARTTPSSPPTSGSSGSRRRVTRAARSGPPSTSPMLRTPCTTRTAPPPSRPSRPIPPIRRPSATSSPHIHRSTGRAAPRRRSWSGTGPTIGGTPALVSDGDVAVPTFDIPAPVPQPGTSDTLDSLDARLTQAVAVNDPGAGGAKGIWTQHTVAGPGGRSVVRWYEILAGTPADAPSTRRDRKPDGLRLQRRGLAVHRRRQRCRLLQQRRSRRRCR